MNVRLISYLLLLSLFLQGCFREDQKITPTPRNDIYIPYSLYEYQTYFNLETQSVVSFHRYDEWDLGFACSDSSYHVILNYARFMMAGNTGSQTFDAVTSAEGVPLTLDASSGNPDSTAIGTWWGETVQGTPVSNHDVYILSRGSDENGTQFGYVKIQFGDYTQQGYTLRFANLDGTNDHTAVIPKDTTVQYVLFSLDDGGSVKVTEPPKNSWDLCFTKYSTILYEYDTIPTPYLVRGVYINQYRLAVARDYSFPFDQITYGKAVEDYTYSNAQDAIGYDWKEYTDGVYQIVDNLTYLIRTNTGTVDKLRFTSFFTPSGERGYPSFELAQLQ